MRIIEILPSVGSESGGPVRATLANSRALHAVQPSLQTTLAATTTGLTREWEEHLRSRLPERMDLRLFEGMGSGAFTFSWSMARWLHGACETVDLVVVGTVFNPLSTWAARAAIRAGVPYVLVPHGTISRYTLRHRRTLLKQAYFSLFVSQTLKRAAAVRFTTEAERDEAWSLADAREAAVIPHAFEANVQVRRERRRSGHHLLFLSRLHPVKGLDLLLKAFQGVVNEVPGARLTIAGSGAGEYENAIRTRIRELHLKRFIDLPGFVEGEDKRRLFDDSSVFVLPSHYENFGIAAVEAMAMGLPVVLTRGVQIWREVAAGEAGLVVGRNPSELAGAIIALLRDGELRSRLGRAGQRLVRQRFAPDRIGPQLSRFYQSAIESYPASGLAGVRAL